MHVRGPRTGPGRVGISPDTGPWANLTIPSWSDHYYVVICSCYINTIANALVIILLYSYMSRVLGPLWVGFALVPTQGQGITQPSQSQEYISESDITTSILHQTPQCYFSHISAHTTHQFGMPLMPKLSGAIPQLWLPHPLDVYAAMLHYNSTSLPTSLVLLFPYFSTEWT
jgi:hypothetical protein